MQVIAEFSKPLTTIDFIGIFEAGDPTGTRNRILAFAALLKNCISIASLCMISTISPKAHCATNRAFHEAILSEIVRTFKPSLVRS